MFEKLLKYPFETFQKGDFAFKLGLPKVLIALIFAAAAAFAIYSYRRSDLRVSPNFLRLLTALRTFAFLFIAFCLLKPILKVPKLMPQGSYLAIMIDASKSMQIKDLFGKSRFEAARELLSDPKSDLIAKLESKFKTRLYRFDSEAKSVSNLSQVSPDGESTDIPNSINQAFDELRGVPLSGIVLLTDGGDKSGSDISQVAYKMRGQKVPIHTVAIGSSKLNPDLEIERISAPQTVEEEASVEISVSLKRDGFPPMSAMVNLSSGSRNLSSSLVELDKDHPSRRLFIRFVPRGSGMQRYTVSVASEEEIVPQNNSKSFFVKVIPNQKIKVLYLAGRANWEYKFIRRALEEASNISLVSAVQINPDSTRPPYRQGVKEPTELLSGYPSSKEELFSYDVLIFGNLYAHNFNQAQLQNAIDYISDRGGGFLLLGDRTMYRTFAKTPLAKALPVAIDADDKLIYDQSKSHSTPEFRVKLTSKGRSSPVIKLSDDAAESDEKWSKLPALTGYAMVDRAKPGATILAVHPTDRNQYGPRILMAVEEYGAGRTTFFAPYDSWRWKMLSEASDNSQEKFWRQLITWLATQPQSKLKLELKKTSFAIKEPVILQASVLDEKFQPTDHAQVKAVIESENPDKRENIEKFEVDLEGQLGEDGIYRGEFIPTRYGEYKVKLSSTVQGKQVAETEGVFNVEESYAEFSNSQLKSENLIDISKLSGGYFYNLRDAHKLPDDIPFVKSGASIMVDQDLWDMPLILISIILCLSIEWFLRKRKGIA